MVLSQTVVRWCLVVSVFLLTTQLAVLLEAGLGSSSCYTQVVQVVLLVLCGTYGLTGLCSLLQTRWRRVQALYAWIRNLLQVVLPFGLLFALPPVPDADGAGWDLHCGIMILQSLGSIAAGVAARVAAGEGFAVGPLDVMCVLWWLYLATTRPVQDGPVQDGPVQDGPVQDGPVQDGPVQDGPVQDGPVQDGPVQDGPVQDGPVQDGLLAVRLCVEAVKVLIAVDKALDAYSFHGQPVDGQPVDGQPVDDKPVDGQPVDGQPVDGQPVDGQLNRVQTAVWGAARDMFPTEARREAFRNVFDGWFRSESVPRQQTASPDNADEEVVIRQEARAFRTYLREVHNVGLNKNTFKKKIKKQRKMKRAGY